MPLMPKRVKYRKTQRGSRKGTASRNLRIDFGEFGLQTLERAWITNTQIEAARVALTRSMKRKGKLWIRIFPDKSVTARPPETRMGKGADEVFDATSRGGGLTRNEIQGIGRNEQRRVADKKARHAPGEFASAVATTERTTGTAEPVAVVAPGRREDRDGLGATSSEGGDEIILWPEKTRRAPARLLKKLIAEPGRRARAK